MVIRGRVQGVGYRWWAVREAERLGVDGWVRNRRDGAVELVAVGPEDAVAALADACRQGPAAAAVSGVELTDVEDHSTGFEARATA